MRIRSSTESFDDSTVDRYCCCASEVAPPTSTSTFTFGLRFWYSSAILRITSGRCWPPVKMRSVVCCAHAFAARLRRERRGQQRFPESSCAFLLRHACPRVRRESRLPVGAADRAPGPGSNRWKRSSASATGERLPDPQPGVGREAAGHLACVAPRRADEAERFGAERLDQHHLAVDARDVRLAGRARPRCARAAGRTSARGRRGARTRRRAVRAPAGRRRPSDAACARLRRPRHGRKFIGGEPVKPATNCAAGRL